MAEGKAGFHKLHRTRQSGLNDGKLDRDAVQPHQPPKHHEDILSAEDTTYIYNGRSKEPPACPQCSSSRICKAGFDAKHRQLFLCHNCFKRFQIKGDIAAEVLKGSDAVKQLSKVGVRLGDVTAEKLLEQSPFQFGEDVLSHNGTIVAKAINTFRDYNSHRRVCVTEAEGSKNLAAVETSNQKTAQDRKTEQTLKGELVTFGFHLSKQNLDKKTIYSRARNIDLLYRNGANLADPDSVLTILATNECWSSGFKNNLLQAYKSYAKWKKIDLSGVELPKYKRGAEQPYVPKETLLDQMIAGAGWKTGTFCQLLKETGARTIEAAGLKWSDIDREGRVVTIRNPAKNGMPRQIHVSEKCVEMLNRQPHKSDYVFGKDPEYIRRRMRANFHWARGHIAAKTANGDFLRVHLHTFRHFFATKLYLQTRDIRYVQKKMGHRSITSTTIYENSEPNQDVETYVVKAVTTREEAEKLIALGYEFHYRTQDGVDLFRKKVIGLD